jgi:hypothetical protein
MSENIDATPHPFAEFSIAQGRAKVKLGGVVNKHYKPSK